jgi:hypothetical protein
MLIATIAANEKKSGILNERRWLWRNCIEE